MKINELISWITTIFSILSIPFLLVACSENYDHRLSSTAISYFNNNDSIDPTSNESLIDSNSYWVGDDITGIPSILIDISNQKLYFYKNSQLVGIAPICSGKVGRLTPLGNFKIINKDPNHVSSTYGDFVDSNNHVVVANVDIKAPHPPNTHFVGSSMQWYMEFKNSVGMHSGYMAGRPDSHGCVRLPNKMAKIFYENTTIGTKVQVIP